MESINSLKVENANNMLMEKLRIILTPDEMISVATNLINNIGVPEN